MDCDPVIEVEAVAVAEPDIEERTSEDPVVPERQLCCVHAIDRHDREAGCFESAANHFADNGLVLDVENCHTVAR